ncbi:MAG TPA: hypothetical protein VGC13_07920 [Longimicrobium sp.]|uniref:hypothetical protein n=1 Tax=Longimicrobium sp. TaxID=2029185 RepID=UPI002EDB6570
MKKLKLQLDDLGVESFDTTCTVREKGTVVGEQGTCTCNTQCTCPGCPTCYNTCAYTCDDATCPACPTCAASCNGTCVGATCYDTCGASCYDSCRPRDCIDYQQ